MYFLFVLLIFLVPGIKHTSSHFPGKYITAVLCPWKFAYFNVPDISEFKKEWENGKKKKQKDSCYAEPEERI